MTKLVNKTEAELAAMVKDLDNQILQRLEKIWTVYGKAPDTGDFESPIEHLLYDACIDFGIAGLRLQFPVGPYRADLAIPHVKIAIEADGADYHQDKARDKKRDDYFRSQGWQVLRFTGSQIHRDPEGCGRVVKEALDNRTVLTDEPAPFCLRRVGTGDVIEW